MRRLGAASGIATLRLARNVLMSGRATENRIDVLWEFEPAPGRLVRLLFECRSYTRRINQQALHITDLTVNATEQLGPDASVNGALGDFFLDFDDGTSERLADHLLYGEMSSLEEPPTQPHPVMRTFPAPVLLRRQDEPVARVVQITATVAESQAEPVVIETAAQIAWMLADTLTGSHTWFATDGRIRQTPS